MGGGPWSALGWDSFPVVGKDGLGAWLCMHSSAGQVLPKSFCPWVCLAARSATAGRGTPRLGSHPTMDGDLLSCCPTGTGETPTLSTLDFYMAKLHSAIESNPLQHEKLVVRIKEILSRIARWVPVSWHAGGGVLGCPHVVVGQEGRTPVTGHCVPLSAVNICERGPVPAKAQGRLDRSAVPWSSCKGQSLLGVQLHPLHPGVAPAPHW